MRERLLNCEACRASDSISVLEAESGTLDIKRRKPDVLFISFQVVPDYDVIIDFLSIQCHWRPIQKVQRHDDLIKAHAMRQATLIRSTCNNADSDKEVYCYIH